MEAVNVVFAPRFKIDHQFVAVFSACIARSFQVLPRIERYRRVEQFLVGEAVRSDFQLLKGLTRDGVPHDGGEHRNVAGLDLAGLVPTLRCDVRHGESTGARFYEPGIPLLMGVFQKNRDKTLLYRGQRSTNKERPRILKHCHSFFSKTKRATVSHRSCVLIFSYSSSSSFSSSSETSHTSSRRCSMSGFSLKLHILNGFSSSG